MAPVPHHAAPAPGHTVETFAKLRRIFDTLKAARTATFREDFALVLDTFSADGPEVANALVRVMLAEGAPVVVVGLDVVAL